MAYSIKIERAKVINETNGKQLRREPHLDKKHLGDGANIRRDAAPRED
jgi:hypothetical protein